MEDEREKALAHFGIDYDASLAHFGVKGMKWGRRKSEGTSALASKMSNENKVIKKEQEITRVMPKAWKDREAGYRSGHMYGTITKEDNELYKYYSKLLGGREPYVNMTVKLNKELVGPSERQQFEAFVDKLKDVKYRDALEDQLSKFITFTPKKVRQNLDKFDELSEKQQKQVYRKASFAIVSNRDLRDPYFKSLQDAGFDFVIDESDRQSGIAKSPVILFDRGVIDSVKFEDVEDW